MTRVSNKQSKCNLCGKIVSSFRGTTTQTRQHLLREHTDNSEVMEAFEAKAALKRVNEETAADWSSKVHIEGDKSLENENRETETIGETFRGISNKVKEELSENTVEHIPEWIDEKVPKNSSPVWMFAKRLDASLGQCDLCGKIYKTKDGTTTAIREHLLTVHPEETSSSIKPTQSSGRVGKITSPARQFTTKISNRHAQCNLCGKIVSATQGTTTQTRQHLLKAHADNAAVVEAFDRQAALKKIKAEEDETEKPTKAANSKKILDKTSKVVSEKEDLSEMWHHFEKMDEYAKCKYCLYKVFKLDHPATMHNLTTHLSTEHTINQNRDESTTPHTPCTLSEK
jgi:hypothetical protein